MNQMNLFDTAPDPKESAEGEGESVTIRTGRVGPICFGATATSLALTRDVLSELAASALDETAAPT